MDDQMQEQGSTNLNASSRKASSKKGRGPSKYIQTSKPMFLEFNALDLPTGEWESAYGKQVGLCAKRIDINVKSYPKMDKVEKDNYWEETKRKFHIEDPNGAREKKFHKAVATRFRCHKSNLRSRFIYLTNPHPP